MSCGAVERERARVDRRRIPIRSTFAVFQLSIGLRPTAALLLIDKLWHEPSTAVRTHSTLVPRTLPPSASVLPTYGYLYGVPHVPLGSVIAYRMQGFSVETLLEEISHAHDALTGERHAGSEILKLSAERLLPSNVFHVANLQTRRLAD